MTRIVSLRSRTALLLFAWSCLASRAADCAEIKVMTSGGFAASVTQLAPLFERATHNKVVLVTTSMGLGRNSIPNRVRSGEAVDVVLLPDTDIQALIAEGFVLRDTRTALANSMIGMVVRSGAPKPDISSVEALKRTLLQAKSIAYSAQVSGQYLSSELFPRLGIAEQIKNKSQRVERERVGAVVARGEAEIGFQQISELLPIQGIDFVGPLPAEVQRITLFSAGVPSRSTSGDTAKLFIRFIASPDSAPAIAKSGLEPIPSR
jgi:molybdate transport system substrate-binding protein